MKILIIDDHPLVSEGIAGLLSTLGEDVKTSTVQNCSQGIELALTLQPDLILLDLQMPDMNGFDVLSVFCEKLPATSVVIVSGSLEPKDMEKAIRMGAMGFIPKTASSDIMCNALKLIMSGGIYIPPEMVNIQRFSSQADSTKLAATENLTPRQLEVLALLSQGKVNKEIARILDCAENTVKAHVTAVFRELGARNRTEAVINAQRLGLLKPDQGSL